MPQPSRPPSNYDICLERICDIQPEVAERFSRHDLTDTEPTTDPDCHGGQLVSLSSDLRPFMPLATAENAADFRQRFNR